MKKMIVLFPAFILMGTGAAMATPVVYTPVNPSFGGNPNNAAQLLAAAAVSRPEQKTSSGISALSPDAQLAAQIKSIVVAGIANKIAGQMYGEGATTTGNYSFGDGSSIAYDASGVDIKITITNTDGSHTTLSVPKPTV